ncbi:MAG: hypothetical protein LUG87_04335 [Oscillospiraceae bacterium]|nr:hypothetical protein [Oscillospiraceae bacterium]
MKNPRRHHIEQQNELSGNFASEKGAKAQDQGRRMALTYPFDANTFCILRFCNAFFQKTAVSRRRRIADALMQCCLMPPLIIPQSILRHNEKTVEMQRRFVLLLLRLEWRIRQRESLYSFGASFRSSHFTIGQKIAYTFGKSVL